MRINKVSVENFKCFKAVDIELGKLTLLTGANSSGKSSILYSILGALQSGEFPFQFSPNGKYVNMGNFQEMSYKHIRENIIKIELIITDDQDRLINLTTWWEEDKLRKLPHLYKLHLVTDLYKLEIIKKRKYTLKYELLSKEENIEVFPIRELFEKVMVTSSSVGNSKTTNNKNDKKDDQHIKMDLKKLMKIKKSVSFTLEDFSQIPKLGVEKGGLNFISDFLSITTMFNDIDKRINFISSFRLYPERTYYEKTKTDLTIGKFGEGYENQIIFWETKKSEKYKELIKIMRNLSLLDNISSRRLEGGRFEIVVKVNDKSVPASLNDVGFGISQFLPVIVADLQLSEGSTLFVAQPEIHLHPGVQAGLGNYVIDQIKQAKKNYIIETHSEYLLNRIRLAIVKKEIPKEDVRVYYLQNDGQDVVTHQLEFTEDGQILNAPEDFFKTYMIDVMEIAMKVAE